MQVTYIVRNLREALARRGVTIKQAARYVGVHADSLERIFKGTTGKFDIHLVDRLVSCIALRQGDVGERDRMLAEIFDMPAPGAVSTRSPETRLAALRAQLIELGCRPGDCCHGQVRPLIDIAAESPVRSGAQVLLAAAQRDA